MILRPARRVTGIERTLIRRIFDEAPPGAINLGLGQPDLATPTQVALAGIGAIARGETGYTSTAGDPRLRRAIADSLRPAVTGPEQVVVTVGSQEAMFAALLALADAGDEVLYPDPGYPAYPVAVRLLGARPVPYPLHRRRGFRPDPREIESLLSERTGAVILCALSNPTGACMDAADLAELVRVLDRAEVPWISDEIYAGFYYGDRLVSPADVAPRNGLIVSGLSKDMSMTGWRIGWVAGPEEIVSRIVAAHQYLVTCAPSVSQSAALGAFTAEGRAERGRRLEIFRGRRALMAEELSSIPRIRFDLPDGAFYFFVDVSEYGESLELARRILQRGRVVTIPGEAFGERGRGFLRVSFAASDTEIREGVRRIARELGG